ncbi:MAG: hypothetical protein U9P14_04495 [Gemmatimonadota bacterium]|nr:hypothetical protein [Gemmatimonadota bacterium]
MPGFERFSQGTIIAEQASGLYLAIFKCAIEEYHRFVRTAYRLTVQYSLWGSLILLTLGLYYFWGENDPDTAWLLVIGASFFPAMFMDRWIMVYMGKGMFARTRTYEVVIKLVSIVLAGTVAYYTGNVLIVMACRLRSQNPGLQRSSEKKIILFSDIIFLIVPPFTPESGCVYF